MLFMALLRLARIEIRRVAEVFGGVFVLTGIFIKGGFQIRASKARASRGVWGHAPPKNFKI